MVFTVTSTSTFHFAIKSNTVHWIATVPWILLLDKILCSQQHPFHFILSISDNDGKNNEKKKDKDFITSKCLLKSHQILLHVITVPLTHSDAFSISKISFRQCEKSAFIPKPFDLIFMNRNQQKIDRNLPKSPQQSCQPNEKKNNWIYDIQRQQGKYLIVTIV